MEQFLKEKYEAYLFRTYAQGDIWWLDNRAYTFQEWIEEGCPENGGYEIKKKE